MDFGVLTIGIISVLIFVVPFLIFNLHRRNSTKRLMNAFIDEASKRKIQISESDIWNRTYCIGVDPVSKHLLYNKTNDYTPELVQINLNEVSKCRIVNNTHIAKNDNQKVAVTDAISLAFNYKNQSKPEVLIEIYDSRSSKGGVAAEEAQIAEKWERLVNNIVKQ